MDGEAQVKLPVVDPAWGHLQRAVVEAVLLESSTCGKTLWEVPNNPCLPFTLLLPWATRPLALMSAAPALEGQLKPAAQSRWAMFTQLGDSDSVPRGLVHTVCQG